MIREDFLDYFNTNESDDRTQDDAVSRCIDYLLPTNTPCGLTQQSYR